MPHHAIRLRCVLAFLFACTLPPAIQAQSTEANLKSRLIGKPLYLRGFWRDDNLHFDPTGHLRGTSAPVPFTLSGIDLKKVHLKSDKLILEGRRMGLELTNNKQKRVALNAGEIHQPEDEAVHIEIEANPTGNYSPALDAIFTEGLAGLTPSLPFYWARYAQKNFLPADSPTNPPASSSASSQPSPDSDIKPRRIGGGVTAPTVLHYADPEFNDAARKLKFSGTTLINLHVEPDGAVTHLSIVRALGLGLDERALVAAQQHVFSPAMENGKPVLVELNIEINFQIF